MPIKWCRQDYEREDWERLEGEEKFA